MRRTTTAGTEEDQFPAHFVWCLIALCTLPAIFSFVGADFSSLDHSPNLADLAKMSPSERIDSLRYCLQGSFLHNLLEWTAVCLAVLTAMITFVNFNLTRTMVTPVIGAALFWSGCVDAFHTLASDHFIHRVADARRFIPLTWTASRLFSCVVLLAGAALLLLGKKNSRWDKKLLWSTVTAFGIGSYLLVQYCANSRHLPVCLFPGKLLVRPYDLIPAVLYLAVGYPLFRLLNLRENNRFSHALLLSILPQSASELHMALGSSALYDNHFNIAHFLKVVAYAVPLAGLLLDYMRTYRSQAALVAQLEKSSQMLHEEGRVLELARARAERALRVKDEFVANMSHEIRTPMNGVIGSISLLVDSGVTEAQREYVETIRTCGDALLSLVNDILDLEKIEAGKLSLEQKRFSLQKVVDDALAVVGPSASSRGLELRQCVERDLREFAVVGDPQRLRQVLLNLTSNAVKFTEHGQVCVEASLASRTEDWAEVRFVVRDTGIGIPPELQETIFQPFTQGDSSTTRRYGGTGLGLSICKMLLTLMEGKLELESEPGHGSAFSFTLRFRIAPKAALLEPETQFPLSRSLRLLRILLVEDNLLNQKIALRLLESMGHQVDTAGDGEQAVAALTARSYDLVLMDCQMPNMDGYAATRAIRRLEHGSRTPIVALTANAMSEDRQRCLDAGMDDFLSKPVSKVRLSDLIAALPTPQYEAELAATPVELV